MEPTLAKAPTIKIVPMIGSLGCPYTCSFCIDSTVDYQPLSFTQLRDDLMRAHRELTREVLEFAGDGQRGEEAIDAWADRRAATLERSLNTLADIRASRTYDTTTLPVALREVRSLIRGGEGEPSGGGRDD